MSRWTFLIYDKTRAKLHAWLAKAPVGMIVEFRENKRTSEQNSKLWPMLTDISLQLTWHGQKYPPEDWKDFLMHQLRGGRWMPAEDGGMVPVGFRTSELTKAEFSDLIEVAYAFGARNGVEWSEPQVIDGQGGSEANNLRSEAAA
jgi:hypothetical protein